MIYRAHDRSSDKYFDPHIYDGLCFLPHIHSQCEAILVLEGELTVSIGARTETAGSGDAAIILGDQLHSLSAESPSRVWITLLPEESIEAFNGLTAGRSCEGAVFRCPPEVIDYFRYSDNCTADSDLCARRAFAYMLCSEFLRRVKMSTSTEKGEKLLNGIMDYISKHYSEDISLTMIADELGYEPHYLSRFFHKTANINLKKLINQYRISHAAELLLCTDTDISAVAAECGFQSVRNFNRAFLNETGTVPGALRRSRTSLN